MLKLLLSFLLVNLAFSLTEKNFTENSGIIKSVGNDGDFNKTIKYNVRVPNGKRAKLSFKDFHVLGSMPDCNEDSLEIMVGCTSQSKSIGKFCSCGLMDCESKLFDIYSKDECITLILRTDAQHINGTGFEAHYSSSHRTTPVSKETQCRLLNVSQKVAGNFFTPEWPNRYYSNFSCTWTLSIPSGYNAMIYFMNFRIEQNIACPPKSSFDDLVRITGSNGTKNETIRQRLCSGVVDKTFSVPIQGHHKVYVTFVSDNDNVTDEETGFATGFLSYKSGIPVADDQCKCKSVVRSSAMPPTTCSIGCKSMVPLSTVPSMVPLSTVPSAMLVIMLAVLNFLLSG